MAELPEAPRLLNPAVDTAKPVIVATPIADVAPAPSPDKGGDRQRYWTEDRIIRVGMMLLFAAFAVGLVVSLARWDAIAHVPFLPWLVGAALVAGPAWKAYGELAEEAKGRRTRSETRQNGYGVHVTPPVDRSRG